MIHPHYIVGLTEGEGCFYVNIRERRPQWTPIVEAHFYLKMQENYRSLLGAVRDTFDCGGVYFQKEKRRNHCHCYRFEINSQKDIEGVLIPFFRKYPLLVPKKRDFEIFCQIVALR